MSTPTAPQEIEAEAVRILRWQRRALDLSQADLADRMKELGMGWVRSTVAKVEAGMRRLNVAELCALCRCLHVPGGPDRFVTVNRSDFRGVALGIRAETENQNEPS